MAPGTCTLAFRSRLSTLAASVLLVQEPNKKAPWAHLGSEVPKRSEPGVRALELKA